MSTRPARPGSHRTSWFVTPLLSVVVPTRNRQACAMSLVEGLRAVQADDFELVLHDNSDNDSLGAFVAGFNDPRLRYLHTADRLNMHENFDRAIHASRGVYVCGLGDDDGLLVDAALSILRVARDREIDAVLPGVHAFNWPGLKHWFWGDVGGRLIEPGTSNADKQRMLDPDSELATVFAAGVTRGLGLLPRVYQGIVSRRSLDAVWERCGTYFPGPSPDMANAVALAATVSSIWLHPEPVIISGHSPKSGGGAGAAGKHHGRLEDQPHLPPGTLESWTPAIPRFWSGFTIYAQSAQIAAARSSPPAPPRMNLVPLYAACFVFERPPYWPLVWEAMRMHPRFGLSLILAVAARMLVMLAQRSYGFAGNFLRFRLYRGDRRRFADMAELMQALGAQPTPDETSQPQRT